MFEDGNKEIETIARGNTFTQRDNSIMTDVENYSLTKIEVKSLH